MKLGSIIEIELLHLVLALLVAAANGCARSPSQPAPAGSATDELPLAYTRDRIVDPKLADVARSFTAWLETRKAGSAKIFLRAEILPPAPTLLPYGIGTYQKETRLPVIVITGPGWASLKPDECEALATQVFQDLTERLTTIEPTHPMRPTLTIQTPLGLELGWINQLEPGRKLLHGMD